MTFHHSSDLLWRCAIVATAVAFTNTKCNAAEPVDLKTSTALSQSDERYGGVLQESFGYHRAAEANAVVKHPTIAPPGGWYGYGFPVKTYRWGWFGAEHYYPRVLWHHGYNGDHFRWSYRHGY